MDFFITIIEQGLIYGILALGVYITYKILDFPDLTTDGSFPLGAAVTAALISRGVNPYLTLPIAFAAGALASNSICGRGTGRRLYRTDPCERTCQRSLVRHYYDDGSLDHQPPDCRDL